MSTGLLKLLPREKAKKISNVFPHSKITFHTVNMGGMSRVGEMFPLHW